MVFQSVSFDQLPTTFDLSRVSVFYKLSTLIGVVSLEQLMNSNVNRELVDLDGIVSFTELTDGFVLSCKKIFFLCL